MDNNVQVIPLSIFLSSHNIKGRLIEDLTNVLSNATFINNFYYYISNFIYLIFFFFLGIFITRRE